MAYRSLEKFCLSLNIDGKFLRIVTNMYKGIKSCVNHNNKCSSFFLCQNGVRQGENLSPILFAIYLNDLEDLLNEKHCNGIKLKLDHNPDLFIILTLLFYADETAILADTPDDLKKLLNDMRENPLVLKIIKKIQN